jgi:hypothetical protein
MIKDNGLDTQLIHMLLYRLERISADSYWAHRASGVRGALLRLSEDFVKGRPVQGTDMQRMMDLGFNILEKAGREAGREAGPSFQIPQRHIGIYYQYSGDFPCKAKKLNSA